jgi:predicted nucleotidyltransferase
MAVAPTMERLRASGKGKFGRTIRGFPGVDDRLPGGAGCATLEVVTSGQQHEVEDAMRLAARCASRFPTVTRMWLFGSAARGGTLDWRSDLDFAVEGLAAPDHVRLLSLLMEGLPRAVDLVRLEEANPTLRSRIHTEGRLIYEHEP